jgi:hypothetical protein
MSIEMQGAPGAHGAPSAYFDNAGRDDVQSGSIKRIEVFADVDEGKF